MKYKLLIGLYALCIFSTSASIWQRKINNYNRNTYHANPQNWMISQDENENIYIANSDGLLEFNGVYWNLHPMNYKITRCLYIDGTKIYTGGSSEFGYFEKDINGHLQYHSLSSNLTDWAGEVWTILKRSEDIIIVDEYYIQVFRDGKRIKLIESFTKIDCAAIINNSVYIGTPNGIYRLDENDQLDLISKDENFVQNKIVKLLPFDDGVLVITAHSGIYNIKNNRIQKVHTLADSFISKNQLFSADISDSILILGSVQNGACLVDLKNSSDTELFNLSSGLKNNTVLNTFFDKTGNLWLALDKGISHINLKSPISPLFANESPIGTGYCSALYNNNLYLGTNQGVYKIIGNTKFQMIDKSEGQIWSMLQFDNSLFCSGDNGIIVITPTTSYKIPLRGSWEIHPLKSDKNAMIVATYAGFSILKKNDNNRWEYSHTVEHFYSSAKGFIEDEVANDFWVTDKGKIFKVTLDKELRQATNVIQYKIEGRIIQESSQFRIIDNNLFICAENGIYRYNRISNNYSKFTELEAILKGALYYEYLYIDAYRNIWFVVDKSLYFTAHTSEGYAAKKLYWELDNQLIMNYENITLTSPSIAIIAVDNAFTKLDISHKYEEYAPRTFIDKIVTNKNDSIVYYGNKQSLILPYSSNNISIYFGSSDYNNGDNILYSCRIKNKDEEWSIPSNKTFKEYTDLPSGKYTFEVKALLPGNTESVNTATIDIRILPPWYRTIWANIGYFLLLVSFLWLIYLKTINKQNKLLTQKKKELALQQQKYEIEKQSKDQKIIKLQNEQLTQELNYKTQELTGFILNLQQKNEMLEGLKKNVIEISHAIDEKKQQSLIRQKVINLITLINSNIEHDENFHIFESNFDLIHDNFFKILDTKYPQLTKNDKVLCAYLKMNLSSKEIAPLLNITVRGVEISRYRLRKKMNLDRNINLSEFMQSLTSEPN